MTRLPPGIAAPAARALAAAGLTTLEAVARAGPATVAELHGMGPKALAVLDAAIEAQAIGGWREEA